MVRIAKRFLTGNSGATAIEYGLIAALVAVVLIVGLSSLGTSINGMLSNVAGNISAK